MKYIWILLLISLTACSNNSSMEKKKSIYDENGYPKWVVNSTLNENIYLESLTVN